MCVMPPVQNQISAGFALKVFTMASGLRELKRRVAEFSGCWLNSNVPSLVHPQLKPYDVVTLPSGRRIGLLGLLLNEPGAFRDGIPTDLFRRSFD